MFVIEGTEYEACPTFSQIGRPLQAMPLEYWEWSERHSYTPEAEQYTLLLSAEKTRKSYAKKAYVSQDAMYLSVIASFRSAGRALWNRVSFF